MSDENGCGDNDADKRPRIYGKAETPDKNIEVTVQGSEGETTDDIQETFEETVDTMAGEADGGADDEPERGGFQ